MQKCIITIFLFFILFQSFGQGRKVSTYLQAQFNPTLYDVTVPNNPWGIGFGAQAFLRTSPKVSLTLEVTADVFGIDDKVQRLNPDDTPIEGVEGMVNVFGGVSYHPAQRIYFSIVAGPSFIGKQTYAGIKPSFGFYLSKNQRWMGKLSFINVFNRHDYTKKDFGLGSLSIGVRLF